MVSSLTPDRTCSASATSAGLLTWCKAGQAGRREETPAGGKGYASWAPHLGSERGGQVQARGPAPTTTTTASTHLDIHKGHGLVGGGGVPVARLHHAQGAGRREGAAQQHCEGGAGRVGSEGVGGRAAGLRRWAVWVLAAAPSPLTPSTRIAHTQPQPQPQAQAQRPPCGMTSMSSSGGEEGDGSSRWLPRLTTCRGGGGRGGGGGGGHACE